MKFAISGFEYCRSFGGYFDEPEYGVCRAKSSKASDNLMS